MSAVRLGSDCSAPIGPAAGLFVGIYSHLGSFCGVFACFFEVSKNFLLSAKS